MLYEGRGHALKEASAAQAALAVVVPVQFFLAHAEFVLDQLRQIFETPGYYLA